MNQPFRAIAALAAIMTLPLACASEKSASPPAPVQDASVNPDAGDRDAAIPGDAHAGASRDARADAADSSPGADDGTTHPGTCPSSNPLKNPYFGDLHAHTSYSNDAFSFGTRNTPFDAYAFAKGKPLQIEPPDAGGPITMIDRPLDFLAVTDHSESLDTAAWQSVQSAAAAANVPCSFTSFVAYEWTLGGSGPNMLHKNVIFASDKVPPNPLDSQAYPTQAELWSGLDQQCKPEAGCQALTIPHNSNKSGGLAFVFPAGTEPQMLKYQRLVEIFQHKGGSECFFDPANPTDPGCNFEYLGGTVEPNLAASYVRTALKQGLVQYSNTKTNPFQLGIIASSDDHNGTPGNTREDTWPGHHGKNDDTPARRIAPQLVDGGNGPPRAGETNPGGLAGIWAEENTRPSLYAALQRRETFGTSGTRIIVRYYQTWDATADPCADPSFPRALVDSGAVPMGGTMTAPPNANARPRFVARAWKDNTDLERIDIIKGWVDAQGQAQEKVVRLPLTAGAPACVVWQDDEFTGAPAFYYARVLERPTPRWSVYDCQAAPRANPTACADGGVLNVQIRERAWTSPIWWMP